MGSLFYTLSKTLDLALSPLFWALVFGAASGLLALRARTRLAWGSGLCAAAILYAFSTGGMATWLMSYAERFDAPQARTEAHYDAIILLGGFIHYGPWGDLELSDAGDRLLRAWEMLSEQRADYVIIAAGGDPGKGAVEADMAADLLERMGIARTRLLLDRTSRNTRQNALEAKVIATRHKLRKLALVTSAFHVQRAVESFRAVGLAVEVWPTDYLAPGVDDWFSILAPRASHLATCELALRELAGRWVYRFSGYAKQK